MALERDAANVVKESGGKVLGDVRAPLNTSGLLVLPAAGPGLQGQGRGARQCRRRHHQCAEAGGRIRHHPRRPENDRAADGDHRHACARAEGDPGPDRHRRVLLGHERRDPRLLQALLCQGRPHADHDPGRPVFGDHALPEGDRGHRHRRSAEGDGADARDPDQRLLRQERQDPYRRPHGPRHVSVRGEEASESKSEWDLYKLLATVPGDEAFRPLDKGGCPLVKSN